MQSRGCARKRVYNRSFCCAQLINVYRLIISVNRLCSDSHLYEAVWTENFYILAEILLGLSVFRTFSCGCTSTRIRPAGQPYYQLDLLGCMLQYTRDELFALRHRTTPCRPDRKAIFSHHLWQPRRHRRGCHRK